MAPDQEPRIKIFQVGETTPRLDKYLASQYPDLSRSRIQKLIEEGNVLVNERNAKASLQLDAGDVICVKIPLALSTNLVAESIPLDIVYEDSDLIVINKPAGIAVHPSPGHTSHTLVNAILAHCPGLTDFGDSLRPGIVHRLDKDTSGLMIVAKNSVAQQDIINQFKTKSVKKGYLVLVRGKLTPINGAIEAPIGRDPSNRKRMAVVTGGRDAKTIYKVRQYLDNNTLLEVTIETGRTHQIRVHFAAIGYPVIGDATYGVKSAYPKRQFVHAFRLGFRLPFGKEYKEFTCELPPDLKQAIQLMSRDRN